MTELTKPNAFVFKARIKEEIRLCVCPRIDNKWSEKDIVYVENYDGGFDDVLDDKLFSIIFVGYTSDENGTARFDLKNVRTAFLKSDKDIAEQMYNAGNFFSTVEKGYQKFYEQPESSGEGQQTTSGEEGSV